MLFEHVARQDRDLDRAADRRLHVPERAARGPLRHRRASTGDEFRRVPLPAGRAAAAGVLTHASVLLSTSNPNRTSPVKRGLFVLENLLGREVPPAAAGRAAAWRTRKADGQDAEDAPRATRRPPGEEGVRRLPRPLRPDRAGAGELRQDRPVARQGARGGADRPEDGTAHRRGGRRGGRPGRSRWRRRKDVFYRCVTEKLLTYALGRGLEPADAVTVDRITARLVGRGAASSRVLLAVVVDSPPFQTRRGDGGERGRSAHRRAARAEAARTRRPTRRATWTGRSTRRRRPTDRRGEP